MPKCEIKPFERVSRQMQVPTLRHGELSAASMPLPTQQLPFIHDVQVLDIQKINAVNGEGIVAHNTRIVGGCMDSIAKISAKTYGTDPVSESLGTFQRVFVGAKDCFGSMKQYFSQKAPGLAMASMLLLLPENALAGDPMQAVEAGRFFMAYPFLISLTLSSIARALLPAPKDGNGFYNHFRYLLTATLTNLTYCTGINLFLGGAPIHYILGGLGLTAFTTAFHYIGGRLETWQKEKETRAQIFETYCKFLKPQYWPAQAVDVSNEMNMHISNAALKFMYIVVHNRLPQAGECLKELGGDLIKGVSQKLPAHIVKTLVDLSDPVKKKDAASLQFAMGTMAAYVILRVTGTVNISQLANISTTELAAGYAGAFFLAFGEVGRLITSGTFLLDQQLAHKQSLADYAPVNLRQAFEAYGIDVNRPRVSRKIMEEANRRGINGDVMSVKMSPEQMREIINAARKISFLPYSPNSEGPRVGMRRVTAWEEGGTPEEIAEILKTKLNITETDSRYNTFGMVGGFIESGFLVDNKAQEHFVVNARPLYNRGAKSHNLADGRAARNIFEFINYSEGMDQMLMWVEDLRSKADSANENIQGTAVIGEKIGYLEALIGLILQSYKERYRIWKEISEELWRNTQYGALIEQDGIPTWEWHIKDWEKRLEIVKSWKTENNVSNEEKLEEIRDAMDFIRFSFTRDVMLILNCDNKHMDSAVYEDIIKSVTDKLSASGIGKGSVVDGTTSAAVMAELKVAIDDYELSKRDMRGRPRDINRELQALADLAVAGRWTVEGLVKKAAFEMSLQFGAESDLKGDGESDSDMKFGNRYVILRAHTPDVLTYERPTPKTGVEKDIADIMADASQKAKAASFEVKPRTEDDGKKLFDAIEDLSENFKAAYDPETKVFTISGNDEIALRKAVGDLMGRSKVNADVGKLKVEYGPSINYYDEVVKCVKQGRTTDVTIVDPNTITMYRPVELTREQFMAGTVAEDYLYPGERDEYERLKPEIKGSNSPLDEASSRKIIDTIVGMKKKNGEKLLDGSKLLDRKKIRNLERLRTDFTNPIDTKTEGQLMRMALVMALSSREIEWLALIPKQREGQQIFYSSLDKDYRNWSRNPLTGEIHDMYEKGLAAFLRAGYFGEGNILRLQFSQENAAQTYLGPVAREGVDYPAGYKKEHGFKEGKTYRFNKLSGQALICRGGKVYLYSQEIRDLLASVQNADQAPWYGAFVNAVESRLLRTLNKAISQEISVADYMTRVFKTKQLQMLYAYTYKDHDISTLAERVTNEMRERFGNDFGRRQVDLELGQALVEMIKLNMLETARAVGIMPGRNLIPANICCGTPTLNKHINALIGALNYWIPDESGRIIGRVATAFGKSRDSQGAHESETCDYRSRWLALGGERHPNGEVNMRHVARQEHMLRKLSENDIAEITRHFGAKKKVSYDGEKVIIRDANGKLEAKFWWYHPDIPKNQKQEHIKEVLRRVEQYKNIAPFRRLADHLASGHKAAYDAKGKMTVITDAAGAEVERFECSQAVYNRVSNGCTMAYANNRVVITDAENNIVDEFECDRTVYDHGCTIKYKEALFERTIKGVKVAIPDLNRNRKVIVTNHEGVVVEELKYDPDSTFTDDPAENKKNFPVQRADQPGREGLGFIYEKFDGNNRTFRHYTPRDGVAFPFDEKELPETGYYEIKKSSEKLIETEVVGRDYVQKYKTDFERIATVEWLGEQPLNADEVLLTMRVTTPRVTVTHVHPSGKKEEIKPLAETTPFLTITEDMEGTLAMKMWGQVVRAYNIVIARGEGPLTLDAMIPQQYRWALGGLHVALLYLRDTFLMLFTNPREFTRRIASMLYYPQALLDHFLRVLPLLYFLLGPILNKGFVPFWADNVFPAWITAYLGAQLIIYGPTVFSVIKAVTRGEALRSVIRKEQFGKVVSPTWARAAIRGFLWDPIAFAVTVAMSYWDRKMAPLQVLKGWQGRMLMSKAAVYMGAAVMLNKFLSFGTINPLDDFGTFVNIFFPLVDYLLLSSGINGLYAGFAYGKTKEGGEKSVRVGGMIYYGYDLRIQKMNQKILEISAKRAELGRLQNVFSGAGASSEEIASVAVLRDEMLDEMRRLNRKNQAIVVKKNVAVQKEADRKAGKQKVDNER